MRNLGKVILSIVVLLVAMLAAAAGVEVTFGEARPGFTPLIILLLAGPILYLIWRNRVPSRGKMTTNEMIEGLRQIIDDPHTTPDKREQASSRLALLEKRKT